MDILSALLGYPVSIFANVSTDYLAEKFRKTPQKQFEDLFQEAFLCGIRTHVTHSTTEEGIKKVFVSVIERDARALIRIVRDVNYGAVTVAELRNSDFKEEFLKKFCDEYSLIYEDVQRIGVKIINSGFKSYELEFLNKSVKSLPEAIAITTLNKIYNDVAKKDDIERLRDALMQNIPDNVVLEDEVSGWFLDEISSVETNDISETIQLRMRQFDKVVEKLTEEQMRVLQYQKYHKRLLIKGCAGSGKTIIASERAIRLSKIGLRTLITCFNPNLSAYIKSLISGETVDVMSFSQLINHFTGNQDLSSDWNIYVEPDNTEINAAFDSIMGNKAYYDAIFVDEGQDFKDHWWEVVEALLSNSNEGMLYIFADDKQDFKKIPMKYPISESPFYLSRNVRNAGKIFELIRQFHAEAPPPSAFLEGFGITKIGNLDSSQISKALIDTINDASEVVDLKDLAILSLTHEIDKAIKDQLIGKSFSISGAIEQKINGHLDDLSWKFLGKKVGFKVTLPLESWHKSKVKELIKECKSHLPEHYQDSASKFYWQKQAVKISDDVEKMEYNLYERSSVGTKKGSFTTTRITNHHVNLYAYYSSSGWSKVIPEIPVLTYEDERLHIRKSDNSIPLLTVSDYKGLEARAIILLIDRPVQDFETFLYVGISRAVYYLSILIDPRATQYIHNTGRQLG